MCGAHAYGGALQIREDGRCVVGVSSMSCGDSFKSALYGALRARRLLLTQRDPGCEVTTDAKFVC